MRIVGLIQSKMNNSFDINRIKLKWISFDSSLDALPSIFWAQLDSSKRSVAKSRKRHSYREMAPPPRAFFVDLWPWAPSDHLGYKNKVVQRLISYQL